MTDDGDDDDNTVSGNSSLIFSRRGWPEEKPRFFLIENSRSLSSSRLALDIAMT